METNPQDYDRRVSWILPQNQPSEARRAGSQDDSRAQNMGLPLHGAEQKPRPPQKMPRARAQALANKLKRGLAISSILGFATFSGLVALHQVGSTTTQAASVSTQSSKSILKQQGGNNFGTSTTTTASSITPTATSQASSVAATPVSGTTVS